MIFIINVDIMRKKVINFLGLLIISLLIWFLNYNYPLNYFQKGFFTFLALAIIYLILKIVFEELGIKKVRDKKARYSFRKTVSVLFIIFVAATLIGIWIENPQSLMLAYGILAAGIAITLQDFFKNFVGGILIFVSGIYRVGDRIEIDNKTGDVIDISLMYTTLLELRGWMSGDQATGRLITMPNGVVLSQSIFNYTKDHNFIWDEIIIPITFDSDWRLAIKKFKEITQKLTKRMMIEADKSISRLEEKYYVEKRVTEPSVFMKLTDNWVELYVKYTVEVKHRRIFKDKLYKTLLKTIEKTPTIKLASATFDIVGFPKITIKK